MLTTRRITLPRLDALARVAKSDEGREALKAIQNLQQVIQEHFDSLNRPGGLAIPQVETFTPSITAGSGTFTTVSGSGTYWKVGSVYHYFLEVVITTAGTAAGAIVATLPFTVSEHQVGVCADVTSSYKTGSVTGGSGSNSISLLGADGLTLIADGVTVRASGFFVVND